MQSAKPKLTLPLYKIRTSSHHPTNAHWVTKETEGRPEREGSDRRGGGTGDRGAEDGDTEDGAEREEIDMASPTARERAEDRITEEESPGTRTFLRPEGGRRLPLQRGSEKSPSLSGDKEGAEITRCSEVLGIMIVLVEGRKEREIWGVL